MLGSGFAALGGICKRINKCAALLWRSEGFFSTVRKKYLSCSKTSGLQCQSKQEVDICSLSLATKEGYVFHVFIGKLRDLITVQ